MTLLKYIFKCEREKDKESNDSSHVFLKDCIAEVRGKQLQSYLRPRNRGEKQFFRKNCSLRIIFPLMPFYPKIFNEWTLASRGSYHKD